MFPFCSDTAGAIRALIKKTTTRAPKAAVLPDGEHQEQQIPRSGDTFQQLLAHHGQELQNPEDSGRTSSGYGHTPAASPLCRAPGHHPTPQGFSSLR